MSKKLTTEEFIEKARKVHKDTYDYKKVNYIGALTKVTITCKIHGDFEQTSTKHLSGQGCPKCGGSYQYTTPEWIIEARKVHKDTYDYKKVNYVNALIKVTITCKKHGDFEQTPAMHLSGGGCSKCAGLYQYTTPEWIVKARKVHKDTYDYKKVKYINTLTKVTITCKIHGDFEQIPGSHLSGQGCSKCAGLYQYTTPEWIVEARKVYKDTYDYKKVKYIGSKTKITITCKKHGDFEQAPNSHLSGRGCPTCNESKGEKVIREYLEIKNIKGCKHRFEDFKKYEYDFYLPKYNCCIEYQGIQHYEITKFSSSMTDDQAKENFKLQKKRDRIKSEYCRIKGIKLIRISYKQFDKIEEILDSLIK
jgi:hypothetical protein